MRHLRLVALVAAALAAGCAMSHRPPRARDIQLLRGDVLPAHGDAGGLSVAYGPGDSVLATWSAQPLNDEPKPPGSFKVWAAASHDGLHWDRVAMVDSVSGDHARLVRGAAHAYVLLTEHGAFFRLGAGLAPTLVNAVDLPGGHEAIELDAAVVEPDSLFVAYSARQIDAKLGREQHLVLLGHWKLGGGLVRLDTLGTYRTESPTPNGGLDQMRVRVVLVHGRPFVLANHLASVAARFDRYGQRMMREDNVLSIYAPISAGRGWPSADLVPPAWDPYSGIDALARGDSLCVFFYRDEMFGGLVLDRDLGGGRPMSIGSAMSFFRVHNDWGPEPPGNSAGHDRGAIGWLRFRDLGESLAPPEYLLLPFQFLGGRTPDSNAMLTWSDSSTGWTPRQVDVSRELGMAQARGLFELASSGAGKDGVLLLAMRRFTSPTVLQLVRYHIR